MLHIYNHQNNLIVSFLLTFIKLNSIYSKIYRNVILAAEYDWPAVVRNLERARAVWNIMTVILSREGAETLVSIFFFKSVVQVVLIFITDTWVIAPRIGRVLGGFQDQVLWRLTGWLPLRKTYGKWYYTLTETSRKEAGFLMM